MKSILPILFLAFVITGCASYPDKVKVEEGVALVNFQTASVATYSKTGDLARWSGVVADVKNLKANTQLDVLFYPSSDTGRPKISGEPVGRFRVLAKGFLDPAVYRKGKSITALGTLVDKQLDKIGEYEYEYPTIADAKVHLWPKIKPLPQSQVYYGWYGPHPRYYWRGGIRYVYVQGQPKSGASAKLKNKK